MFLKNNKKNKSKKKVLLIIMFVMITGLILVAFFCVFRSASIKYLAFSETLVRSKISSIINMAIDADDFNMLDDKSLFTIIKNNKDEIELINYNSITVNKFLNSITDQIQDSLSVFDGNSIIFDIPFFSLIDNPLFNNIGPNIPVKVKNVGYISTNIETVIKNYGINNSLIQIDLKLSITERILLPVSSKDILIESRIPISYKLVKGSIPYYYSSSGMDKSSSIVALPFY